MQWAMFCDVILHHMTWDFVMSCHYTTVDIAHEYRYLYPHTQWERSVLHPVCTVESPIVLADLNSNASLLGKVAEVCMSDAIWRKHCSRC